MAAAFDTTTKTLLWAIILMMNHPEVQEKVQAEIRTVITDNRLVTLSDRVNMPYTNAVMNEMQRYANILPFNFARIVKETVVINGYTLPKGVAVVPQISAILYDESVFENPHDFVPERFLENEKKSVKKFDEMIPFSVGKRSCLGESLARTELFLICVSLMQKFKFSFPPDEGKPVTLSPVCALALGPKPFKCLIQTRE